MTAKSLLKYLWDQDVKIWVERDKIKWDAPRGIVNNRIKGHMRKLKPKLIELLQDTDPNRPQLDTRMAFAQMKKHLVAITQESDKPRLLLPECCLGGKRIEKAPRLIKRGQGDYVRVYRPWKIDEVYGHEEVKEIIQTSLDSRALPNSILFHGESGIGKTTFARIIGAGMLCKHGPTSQPCLKCEYCKYILQLGHSDYLEINAADMTGIDVIREIKGKYYYHPFHSDYRIIVYDECHRLSPQAQDMLLKVVEDSPKQNYSIFCSTEPDKIAEPLKNRCMPFELEKIPDKDIKKMLDDVCRLEGIESIPDVLDQITKEADGRARNALFLLQRAVAAGELE